jgi:predicted dehydrogenase
VIYALGTHTIDQVVILFGVPERVYARMWDIRGIGVDESVNP